MPKTDAEIHDLVRWVKTGELRLPEMQRKYVWPATRVRDFGEGLLKSMLADLGLSKRDIME